MGLWRGLVWLVLSTLLILRPAPAMADEAGPFSDWAAVVVAGDWHAQSGAPSEVFDNARRDIAKSLVQIGFSADNVRQLSVRPERYAKTGALPTKPRQLYETLGQLTTKVTGGCLVYITSHGVPEGIVFGEQLLAPGILAEIINRTCADRPTVAVISACYSGVFVPPLAGSDRMILTAARPDRTSFGCGEADVYTFFDNCFLQEMPKAQGFPALANGVRACVRDRESREGVSPASEPQLFIGPHLRPVLGLYPFAKPSTAQPSR